MIIKSVLQVLMMQIRTILSFTIIFHVLVIQLIYLFLVLLEFNIPLLT